MGSSSVRDGLTDRKCDRQRGVKLEYRPYSPAMATLTMKDLELSRRRRKQTTSVHTSFLQRKSTTVNVVEQVVVNHTRRPRSEFPLTQLQATYIVIF